MLQAQSFMVEWKKCGVVIFVVLEKKVLTYQWKIVFRFKAIVETKEEEGLMMKQ